MRFVDGGGGLYKGEEGVPWSLRSYPSLGNSSLPFPGSY